MVVARSLIGPEPEQITGSWSGHRPWKLLPIDCDYLFLAADSMQARLVLNALVHQYLIPGAPLDAKVTVDSETGDILDRKFAQAAVG